MAVLSSRRRQEPTPAPRRKALVAAASQIPLDGTGWKNFKLGDTEWQKEAWKHYDICGELRFVADFVGKSISRCRLYVAELDALGKAGDEVTDEDIAILAETVFGGPANKAEAQRLLGIHLFTPGESYIVAESVENANDDRWYVVSTSGVKRQGDKDIQVKRPQEHGGGWYTLKAGKDLLIRAWTPHPREYDLADSSVRPALPILREVEQLTKHVFAQIDSRLAGAGLLLLPDQLDFPRGEEDPAGAAGLMAVLQRAMAASLSDRSDPSSLVPIMAQVPGEFIDKVRHITFETPLAKEGMDIRDRALRRLGLSLDIDPEILLGKGDTNHWSAWQLEESTIKVHIEPILARICDALTTGYLRAALTAMGKDPEQYTFWYDTSPLTVRPNRQEDGLELFDKDAISEEALRTAGSWSEDDAPDDEERARRLATKLVLIDPTLIHQEAIQKALGVTWKLEAPEPPAAPPGEEPKDEEKPKERALPQKAKEEPTAAQAALLMGAHMVVQRSLEMAGKRLLTRANRDRFREVAPWELHTQIHVLDPEHAERLLDDTFGAVTMLAERTGVPAGDLREALAVYCRELMVRAAPHDEDMLESYLLTALHAEPGSQYHLPGRHDQKNHGRRSARPDFKPFTPGEKAERSAERRRRVDPDRDAPAPDRQGRRAFREWEGEAQVLNGRFQRQLRDDNAEVLQQPDPPGGDDAKQAEWADREQKMRDDLERMLGVMRKELALTRDLDSMLDGMRQGTEERIRAARALFFDGNPDLLTDAPGLAGLGFAWYDRLRQDTPWDEPIRVTDFTIQGHKVKHGWAWRQDGVTYVVQGPADKDDPFGDSKTQAGFVAQKLAALHKSELPENATEWQKGYLWTTAPSPADNYWQKRFNNPNHRAAASAGDGSVAFWNKSPVQVPQDMEKSHIVHEFGHNFDQTAKTGGRISKSVEWQFAMKDDFDKKSVTNFIQDFPKPGQFRIDRTEGHGKEAPWGVTSYGKSSLAEDLAESLELYRQGRVGTGNVEGVEGDVPVYFRDLFPERAKILDKEFPAFGKKQRANIRDERKRDGALARAERARAERNRRIDEDRARRGLRASE